MIMKLWIKIIIGLAIIPVLVYLGLLGWIVFDYLKYGSVTQQACGDNDWWEDVAECAAQLALEKNDPRYCRINWSGEIGDVCALIYAEKTTDSNTCKKIDLLTAQNKCQRRFE